MTFITGYQGSRYESDDLPLSWLSREGSSDESCHVRNVPAALDLVADSIQRAMNRQRSTSAQEGQTLKQFHSLPLRKNSCLEERPCKH